MRLQEISRSHNLNFQGTFVNNKALNNLRTTLASKRISADYKILENAIHDIEQINDGRTFVYNSDLSASWISEKIGSKSRKIDVTLYYSALKDNYRYLFGSLLNEYHLLKNRK